MSNDFENIIEIPLHITSVKDNPVLVMRKETRNSELIKKLIYAALHNNTLLILPKFNNRMTSLNNMLQKKIIKRTEAGKLEFII